MIKPIALTFALAFCLRARCGRRAEQCLHRSAHRTHGSMVHAPRRTPHGEARVARPAFGQIPREDENLPGISRNSEDCVKTMCTCLAGGGC